MWELLRTVIKIFLPLIVSDLLLWSGSWSILSLSVFLFMSLWCYNVWFVFLSYVCVWVNICSWHRDCVRIKRVCWVFFYILLWVRLRNLVSIVCRLCVFLFRIACLLTSSTFTFTFYFFYSLFVSWSFCLVLIFFFFFSNSFSAIAEHICQMSHFLLLLLLFFYDFSLMSVLNRFRANIPLSVHVYAGAENVRKDANCCFIFQLYSSFFLSVFFSSFFENQNRNWIGKYISIWLHWYGCLIGATDKQVEQKVILCCRRW